MTEGDDFKTGGPTDEILAETAAKGDKAAFRQLFDRYRDRAYRVAYRFVGAREDALDAVQESFVKVYRALDRFEGRSQFRTWLMRIVTNTCLDIRRKRGRRAETSLSEEMVEIIPEESQPQKRPESSLQKMEYDELSAGLAKALDEISAEHRTVFVMHAEEGLTYREIADLLEIKEGTVMSRLFHARKNLQKILSNMGLV